MTLNPSICTRLFATPFATGRATVAATALFLLPVLSAEAKPKLTCSFIAEQCLKECVKEANEQFCSGYCKDQKADCMKTGSWYGIARQFPRVIKR